LAIFGQKKSTPRSESLRRVDFKVDFIGEKEDLSKKALGRESRP
jgi:hypothetical protein